MSPSVKAVGLSFNRDDERAADLLGMQWAFEAGFSPCGSYRLAKRLAALGQTSQLTILSTHPGNQERWENAQLFMQTNGLPACKD